MIIHLTQGITQCTVAQLSVLSKLILSGHDKGHKFSIAPSHEQWLDEQLLNSSAYYGDLDKELYKAMKLRWSPTSEEDRNMGKIEVGADLDNDLQLLLKLAEKPALLIVENGKYDGSAISQWINLYKDKRDYKTINRAVFDRLKSNGLVYSNAGGKNNIPNQAETEKGNYGTLLARRALSIFDSDRENAEDRTDHNADIKRKLDTLTVPWFELEKRMIENYFPWECYRDAGCVEGDRPDGITEEDWDYKKLDSFLADKKLQPDKKKKYTKSKLPDVAKQLTSERLAGRLAHAQRKPDEIQSLILKIYSII